MKTLAILLLFALLLPAATFEVASVKLSSPDAGVTDRERYADGLLQMYNVTLRQYIRYAYTIPEPQIVGGPSWMDTQRFDVVAKSADKAGPADLLAMLQPMLADRFHLVIHRENRTVQGYALTAAKAGVTAAVSTQDHCSTNTARNRITAKGCTMALLAIRLSGNLERPVVDMTGDTRAFDFELRWTPDELPGAGPSSTPDSPSLFTALKEQLGVRLDSRKVPVDVLVVDHAEMPSEN